MQSIIAIVISIGTILIPLTILAQIVRAELKARRARRVAERHILEVVGLSARDARRLAPEAYRKLRRAR
jgi:hypothetical protein